jgi:hypothetical protein
MFGRSVAYSEALDPLHWAMHVVTYWHITMAIKTTSKVGVFKHHCLFACCRGSRWGNTVQIVAQWWCPVDSGIALDILYWGMPSGSPRRTNVAIEMANNRGAFDCHCRLVCMIIRSYKTMLWSIKTSAELQY